MATPKASKPLGDFNADDLAVTQDQHAKDITDLRERLAALEAKFGTHEKIAATLCETATTAIKMREMIANTFISLIGSDQKTKDSVVVLINNTDRHWFYSYAKRIGFTAWSGIVAIAAIGLKSLFDHLTK